jgi:Zinc finger C-x8-C-x5-C-x3-H type (and similar)
MHFANAALLAGYEDVQSTAAACVHWTLKGWCKFGSDCTFSHAMEDALQLYRELQLEQTHHYQHHMNLLHLASHSHQTHPGLAAVSSHHHHADPLLEAVTSSGSSSSGGGTGGQQFSSATASYWYGPTATVPRHHANSGSASGTGRAPTGRRPVCVHWKNNCCQYGDACNFAHFGAGSLQLLPHQQIGRRHAEEGEFVLHVVYY